MYIQQNMAKYEYIAVRIIRPVLNSTWIMYSTCSPPLLYAVQGRHYFYPMLLSDIRINVLQSYGDAVLYESLGIHGNK